MKERSRIWPCVLACVGAGLSLALSGCVIGEAGWPGTYAPGKYVAADTPVPLVQDCAVVAISTPSRFACGGKVMNTHQLQDAREDAAKKLAAK